MNVQRKDLLGEDLLDPRRRVKVSPPITLPCVVDMLCTARDDRSWSYIAGHSLIFELASAY